MTAMEIEAQKASLVRDILTEVNDMDLLKKLQRYFDRMIRQRRQEEETAYISKEELLAGIDAGLKDMKAGRMMPVEELIKELEDGQLSVPYSA